MKMSLRTTRYCNENASNARHGAKTPTKDTFLLFFDLLLLLSPTLLALHLLQILGRKIPYNATHILKGQDDKALTLSARQNKAEIPRHNINGKENNTETPQQAKPLPSIPYL